MFRMRFVMFVGPGEVRPDRVGGVDVVDDAVRVGERVVAPTLAPQAHPLLLLPSTPRPEDWERQQEIFPVHRCVIRPSLSVLIATLLHLLPPTFRASGYFLIAHTSHLTSQSVSD